MIERRLGQQLGQILLRKSIITFKQLYQALKIQKENKKILGDILIEEFGIKKTDIEKTVCEYLEIFAQWVVRDYIYESITKDTMVKRGIINAEKLNAVITDIRVDFSSASVSRKSEVNFIKKDGKLIYESNRYILDRINGKAEIYIKVIDIKNFSIPVFRSSFTYSVLEKIFAINDDSLYLFIKPHIIKIYRTYKWNNSNA
ncbi:hypothetical protein GMMP15_580018 [Candidatus Magnetomoraceae bacterium gMMP-15]